MAVVDCREEEERELAERRSSKRGFEEDVEDLARRFDKMVNATGAGDATMAGILHATRKGLSESEILDWALGAGLVAISGKDTINPDMSAEHLRLAIQEYSE